MKQLRMRFRIAAILVIVLLLGAAGYGIYSVNVYGNRWISSSKNYRYRSARSRVIPGNITDRFNTVVATTNAEGKRVYQSDLLSRASLVHLLGDSEGNVANGIESFQANALLGMNASVSEHLSALLSGDPIRGDSIQLTIDSTLSTHIAQTWRNSDSKDRCGAVVVLNYQTGEILSMVSLPIYDPENVSEQVKNAPTHPFWNRCTQATLPPGSTFKMITAAAALENRKDADTREFVCDGNFSVMDHIITDYNSEQHGTLSLQKAFRISCNNTFAQLALDMGDGVLRKTAENFGFNNNFLFRDLVLENSVYPTANRNAFEVAWSGVGQSRILVTPMHMCMIAGAIANNGIMMEPRLVRQVVTYTGKTRQSYAPCEYRSVCSSAVAAKLQAYMKDVVTGGTGTRAQVSGLTIAGKTGSAESSIDGQYTTHGWFAGYIADAKRPYAVCVLVESGGSGGKTAAPIAKKIFEYLAAHY